MSSSIQNSRTKLQPLHYPQKETYDLDAHDHLFELYDDPDLVSISADRNLLSSKPIQKSEKSLKAKLYQNVVSSEGLSSDEDLAFMNFHKNYPTLQNKHNGEYFAQGPGNKKIPLLLNKFNGGPAQNTRNPTDQRALKPILNQNQNVVPSVTPIDKIMESTKEETMPSERSEQENPRQQPMNKIRESQEIVHKKESRYSHENHHQGHHERINKENQVIRNSNKGSLMDQALKQPNFSFHKKVESKVRQSLNPAKHVESSENISSQADNYYKKIQKLDQSMDLRGSEDGARESIEMRRYQTEPKETVHLSSQLLHSGEHFRTITEASSGIYGKKSSANKEIYKEILLDIQSNSLDPEGGQYQNSGSTHSSKHDKTALSIIEQRLGKRFADGLYEVFIRYCATKESKRKLMTLGKLLLFLKNFGILENNITRESVSIIFVKRCPDKFADFAGFVDILYKIHKMSDFIYEPSDYNPYEKHSNFQNFLQAKILERQDEVMHTLTDSLASFTRLNTTESDMFCADRQALQAFEIHDEMLRKVFRMYWPCNNQYKGHTTDTRKNIILAKEFKEFCYDYGIVPTLCTLKEVLELFRRFHKEDGKSIDYKGFIYILCFIANIGFSRGPLRFKLDTFAKRLNKLFNYLIEVSHATPERACK